MKWVMMRPDPRIADAVGLSTTAIPVRQDRVDEIFAGDRVDLPALLENLEEFATDQPGFAEQLTPTIIWLFETTINELLTEGKFERAEDTALRALAWEPQRTSLKVALGRAQHGLGRHAEATAHWLAAVSRARDAKDFSPMLWLLTARALMEQHRLAAAATLLDDLADTMPLLPEFWELRDRLHAQLAAHQ